MARRSRVELFEQIRKAHQREKLSIHELARRFHTHRRTVRQALASALPPPRKVAPSRMSPVLGPWKVVIDRWLADDVEAPRKQRHTARRVWERLVEEHNADVAESTVRRYVGARRREMARDVREVTVPQHHPLGAEAEIDFGDVSFYLRGVLVVGAMFVMRLSASGKGFHHVFPSASQEALLDGHVRGFDHFGGVPGRIRYDNLKPAVVKILKGRDRQEAERFVALRSHYGFDSFFCIPGPEGAHEKGGVEGEVGRFRRRRLVPVPRVDSFEELNALVAAGDTADDARRIFGRQITVGEHFDLEQGALMILPPEPFDTMNSTTCRVDTKSRICVRQVHYSVPVRYVGRRLEVRLGADRLEVLDGSSVVAAHERAGAKGTEVLTLDHYLEVFQVKPGAFPAATALARARAAGAFGAEHEAFFAEARRRLGDREGTKAIVEVLLAHRVLPTDALATGMRRALSVSSVDPQVAIIEARKAMGERPTPAVPIGTDLVRFERPAPVISHYDDLLEA
ncbi:MAG TPA: IS21 family transposase [Acidimicrobiaceae bacterium]|nr:IS21 family transposase [Acidimicrobiaceae bacterium]